MTRRAMMGGAILYLDGVIFALIADDLLWFKADAVSDALWDAAGCPRFTYAFDNGREGHLNYARAPEDVYDDPDAMRHWTALGLEAGQRAPEKKPRKSRRKGQD